MVTIVVGTQWGDEGKGKIIDYLAVNFQVIARYQGGSNAGHTVMANGKKYIFHLLPSGVLYPDKISILGNGLVIDPASFLKEVESLRREGIELNGRLFISENAHLTLPYHKLLDKVEDEKRGEGKLGTTGRGIGTTYRDKAGRIGIRMADFIDEEAFKEKLSLNLNMKNPLLQKYGEKGSDLEEILREYLPYAQEMKKYITNTSILINRFIDEGKNILGEGAQGTFLDIDFGTYPYVTASNAVSGGFCVGLGVGPTKVDKVLGVAKAYTTRIGEGPFPTEFKDEFSEKLRRLGNEYGATTGRPRRCGWFDAVLVRYAGILNGLTELAITKLDVLNTLPKIKICTHYLFKGEKIDFSNNLRLLIESEPVYEEMDGWQTDISGVRRFADLPEKAKTYLKRIEELTKTKISIISIGAKREETIVLGR